MRNPESLRRWLLVLLTGFGGVAPAAELTALTLDDAIRLALENNLQLRRVGNEVDAAQSRLKGASVVIKDNPVILGMVGPRSSVAGRSLDFGVELLQPIEIAGQRGARLDSAEASQVAALQRLAGTRVALTARVREQFARALAADQRLLVAREATALAQQGRDAAEERFRAGAAPLLEVNTARVDLGRAVRQRAQMEQARALTFAELGFLLGLPPAQELTLNGDLKIPPSAELRTEALVEQALSRRAELKEAVAARESAQAEERLSIRESFPTARVGLTFAHEQETQATIVKGVLGLDLPVFNQNAGPRALAAVRVRQAELAVDAMRQQVGLQVVTAVARLRAGQAAAEGYAGEVVKAMEENMELVTESYRAGKIDFLELVVIRNQAIAARREHIDVLEELSIAAAELELTLGGPAGEPEQ